MTEKIGQEEIVIDNPRYVKELYGIFDKNIKVIENELDIKIIQNDERLQITGNRPNVIESKKIILRLFRLIDEKGTINVQDVRQIIDLFKNNESKNNINFENEVICKNASGKFIKPKTWGQNRYVESMKVNDIVFGIGPAGTGKTYLAMAMAANSLRNKEVSRIILTRPAVEAGESLGFLPGDMQEKVDPYLRPIYDALFDIIGVDKYTKYMERGIIEIAPLAFMRGRTLDSAYIILDEAQNTTDEQMKMLLTRIGYGSKLVITGDVTQIDLAKGKRSGLKTIEKILNDIKGIDFIYLTKKDIVRHHIVQKIIEAYEKYEGEDHK